MKLEEEKLSLARKLKAAVFDSDGVMFPNTVLMGAPYKAKYRSYYDGQAISLLRAIGIRVAFITNEKWANATAIRETVDKFNSLPSSKPQKVDGWDLVTLYEGRGGIHKLETLKELLLGMGVSLEETSYMGDDLVDREALQAVALAVAPAQAEQVIKNICDFVCKREGGAGAIRDFANYVLEARGIDQFTLPPF